MVLAALGVAGLVALTKPVDWESSLGVRGSEWLFVWVCLISASLLTGSVAGVLDGSLAHEGSIVAAILAFVLDALVLFAHWWVAALALGFLQLADERAAPGAVVVPVLGWLLGPLVAHVVSAAVRRRLGERRESPPVATPGTLGR